MIDLRLLRSEPDIVRESLRRRGEDPSIVDEAVQADAEGRAALAAFESKRADQRTLGKAVAQAKGQDKEVALARAQDLAIEVRDLEARANEATAKVSEIAWAIPNIVETGVPAGGEEDYVVLREVGIPRDFSAEGIEVRDHLDIGEALGAIDTERGAKISGARFYFLTGPGAQLELAILNAAMDTAIEAGFVPVIPPTLVKPETMAGTGFLGRHAEEIYRLEADDLYLVGTSEVALAGYHSGEIVDLGDGPLRYAGWSACYRREAGSYGKDTRGIIRVHQFHKVEMFSVVRAEDASEEHSRFLEIEEVMLAKMEIPYRVIDTAAGDLGMSAARKYDCEAWLPSQNRFMEVTSTSNCTTYQARRLGIRERREDGNHIVATVNGTLGTTRWIVALFENHQQADGSVRIPEGLRPYLGGMSRFSPGVG
ncbi:MAG: serine--tRNA ligase [Demequinaceae bacterium]|nr:serine--tRNA ligase [Demequinaceae bacterium]